MATKSSAVLRVGQDNEGPLLLEGGQTRFTGAKVGHVYAPESEGMKMSGWVGGKPGGRRKCAHE